MASHDDDDDGDDDDNGDYGGCPNMGHSTLPYSICI